MRYHSTCEKASLQVSLGLESECEMVRANYLHWTPTPLTATGCRLAHGDELEHAVPIWQLQEYISSYPALRVQRLLITGNASCQGQHMPCFVSMLPWGELMATNLGSLGKNQP